jgi:uncharacterized protein YecE (DUF72 family)
MKSESKSKPKKTEIRVGPAGWSYSDWAGVVYPKPRPREFHEAAYLAEFFDTIEINTSFYQPLPPATAAQWVERVAVHPRFLFTAKLWQRFTHEGGGTAEDARAVHAGFEPLVRAGRLGAVLMQFPFSFHRTPENIARLEKLIEYFSEYPLVVEVRHATWNDADFFAMLRERRVGFCNIDQPVIGRSLKSSDRATSPVGYIRLHGRRYDTWFSDAPEQPSSERYNYLYKQEELLPWVKRIQAVAAGGEKTFVITNNHYQGKAIVNALQLIHLLTRRLVAAPPALIEHYSELEAISDMTGTTPRLF